MRRSAPVETVCAHDIVLAALVPTFEEAASKVIGMGYSIGKVRCLDLLRLEYQEAT